MTFETLMLYFSTAVSALYLVTGGYKAIRSFVAAKFESAVAEKAAAVARKTSE